MAGAQPTPNVSALTVQTVNPPAGLRRGVIVLNHGLNVGTNTAPPYAITDKTTSEAPYFDVYYGTMANILATDKWIVIQPPQVGDQFVTTQSYGIFYDIFDDPGQGTRYLSEIVTWWEAVLYYITTTYGNVPVLPLGFSWGAYHSVVLANLAQSTIVGYAAHCLPTILQNVSTAFLGPAPWSTMGTAANVTTTYLNGVTIPGIVGYGEFDIAVGWDTAGTNGTPVSNTDSLITTAQAFNGSSSLPIRNTTLNNHALLPSESGQQLAGTSSATALSALGTINVATTQNMTGATGQMAIYASDHLWHTVSFTGSTSTTFTGCTYSGNTAATVLNGAPVCLSGNGPTNEMSYPYWVSTVIDPLCPPSF